MSTNSQAWGSRVGLILAMAGNAVGLGNFLRFPVQAVQNGGGAFIIPYLICFLLMGIPLLYIEWSTGRFGGKFGNHSTPYILDSMVKGRVLKYIGVFGIFTNVAVAAYYCYIESWTMSYVYHSLRGTFEGMSQHGIAEFFNNYVDISSSSTGIPYEAVVFYIACLLLNTYILSKGLKGIERVAKIGMPLLILFGVILAIRGLTLGSLIVIPIAAGYLGLDWVLKNAGFGMAFQTMPYLFQQWGPVLAAFAGLFWFGLLFFAGITSSLAMGTPWMGFMKDEFNWGQNKGAWSFGLLILIMGLPTVIFFQEGVFDEYDYWAGTVSLVVFAMLETILFSWIFGMKKGWAEITSGADIKVPIIYKFIIKFITPPMLIIIFLGSLFKPLNNDWSGNISSLFSGEGWNLDNGSIVKTVMHAGIRDQIRAATDPVLISQLEDKILYLNIARFLLLGLFIFVSALVYIAFLKRKREGRATL